MITIVRQAHGDLGDPQALYNIEDWAPTGTDGLSWDKLVSAPFGTVRCNVHHTSTIDYEEVEGWFVDVEVILPSDRRFVEWVSGWVDPLPFADAQRECDVIIQELVTYGPGEWIDVKTGLVCDPHGISLLTEVVPKTSTPSTSESPATINSPCLRVSVLTNRYRSLCPLCLCGEKT